jgi:antitoxin component of MazEF toxin-antitoxin module
LLKWSRIGGARAARGRGLAALAIKAGEAVKLTLPDGREVMVKVVRVRPVADKCELAVTAPPDVAIERCDGAGRSAVKSQTPHLERRRERLLNRASARAGTRPPLRLVRPHPPHPQPQEVPPAGFEPPS